MNDTVLMVLGYLYVLAAVVFSREAWRLFKCSQETSRKLLHILVGNLVLRARIVSLATKHGWTMIDADKSVLEIHKEIKGFLTNDTVNLFMIEI